VQSGVFSEMLVGVSKGNGLFRIVFYLKRRFERADTTTYGPPWPHESESFNHEK
jgi:hypothetical protein